MVNVPEKSIINDIQGRTSGSSRLKPASCYNPINPQIPVDNLAWF